MLFTRFVADLWPPLNTYVLLLAPERQNRWAQKGAQDMSGTMCQTRYTIQPSKTFQIVLPCTREHSFQCDAMCRKGCLNNTLLSSLWTPVLPQGIHFGSQGPSCTGLVFWSGTGTHQIGVRGGCPAIPRRIVTSAPAVAPWIYKYIYIYIYISHFFVYSILLIFQYIQAYAHRGSTCLVNSHVCDKTRA